MREGQRDRGAWPDIAAVGYCCQDIRCTITGYPPEDGEAFILDADRSQGGGAAATAAVTAAKLGCGAAMIANTGDDGTGGQICRELAGYGIDVSCLRRLPGEKGLFSLLLVDAKTGIRTKFPYRDRLPAIDFDGRARAMIKNARVLHIDGTRYDNALRAAEIARENGVPVSMDACVPLPEPRMNQRLLELADIVICDQAYPAAVTGESDPERALRVIAGWGRHRVLMSTAGADGSYLLTESGLYHFPAMPVQAVDTTGCGDVFHGAFLCAWLSDQKTEECIRFASAAAALKARKPGGRMGIPDAAAVQAALECWAGEERQATE